MRRRLMDGYKLLHHRLDRHQAGRRASWIFRPIASAIGWLLGPRLLWPDLAEARHHTGDGTLSRALGYRTTG